MKKTTYQQPVLLVIAPGEPNQPAAAPELEGLEAIWLLEH